jgi:hypothetical protein
LQLSLDPTDKLTRLAHGIDDLHRTARKGALTLECQPGVGTERRRQPHPGPIAVAAFDDKASAAAWKTLPSWAVVATADQAINPDEELTHVTPVGRMTA